MKVLSRGWLFRLEKDGKIRYMFKNCLPLNSQSSSAIAADKFATFEVLRAAGIPPTNFPPPSKPPSLILNPPASVRSTISAANIVSSCLMAKLASSTAKSAAPTGASIFKTAPFLSTSPTLPSALSSSCSLKRLSKNLIFGFVASMLSSSTHPIIMPPRPTNQSC